MGREGGCRCVSVQVALAVPVWLGIDDSSKCFQERSFKHACGLRATKPPSNWTVLWIWKHFIFNIISQLPKPQNGEFSGNTCRSFLFAQQSRMCNSQLCLPKKSSDPSTECKPLSSGYERHFSPFVLYGIRQITCNAPHWIQ